MRHIRIRGKCAIPPPSLTTADSVNIHNIIHNSWAIENSPSSDSWAVGNSPSSDTYGSLTVH